MNTHYDKALIRDALDVHSIFECYGLDMRRYGDWFRSRICPACGMGKSAAFAVHEAGFFVCHRCDKRGSDVFALVALLECLDVKHDFLRVLQAAASIAAIDPDSQGGRAGGTTNCSAGIGTSARQHSGGSGSGSKICRNSCPTPVDTKIRSSKRMTPDDADSGTYECPPSADSGSKICRNSCPTPADAENGAIGPEPLIGVDSGVHQSPGDADSGSKICRNFCPTPANAENGSIGQQSPVGVDSGAHQSAGSANSGSRICRNFCPTPATTSGSSSGDQRRGAVGTSDRSSGHQLPSDSGTNGHQLPRGSGTSSHQLPRGSGTSSHQLPGVSGTSDRTRGHQLPRDSGTSDRARGHQLPRVSGTSGSPAAAPQAYQRLASARQRREQARIIAGPLWASLAHRHPDGESYLALRGLAALIGRDDVVRFDHKGNIRLPLCDALGRIVSVPGRRLRCTGNENKIIFMKGCPTLGTFGRFPDLGPEHKIVYLCEGIIDYLTGLVMFADGFVLGAHGAGNIAKIARGIAPRLNACGMRLRFVPHIGDKKRTGEKAVVAAMDAAIGVGLPQSAMDVWYLPYGDLNDQHQRQCASL